MGKIIVLGAGASKGASFSPTPPVMPGFFREARQWYYENKYRDLYKELWFHFACQNCFCRGGMTHYKDQINLEDLFLRIDRRCQKVRRLVFSNRRLQLLEIIRNAVSTELFALDSLHPTFPGDQDLDPESFMSKAADLEPQYLELLAWRIIRLHLLFLLATFLARRTANQTCQYHQNLVSHLSPGDAVVSFNYDTIVDQALHSIKNWDYSEGYGVIFNPQVSGYFPHKRYGCCELPHINQEEKILLLKPHGSLNWAAVLEPSLEPAVSVNVQDRSFGRPVGYYNTGIANYSWEKALPVNSSRTWKIEAPAIIPPLNEKEVFIGDLNARRPQQIPEREGEHLYVHPYQPVWNLCEQAVCSASQIVFIGYSLPKTDRRARNLFAQAPPHCSIRVVNPDNRVLERYQKLFPDRVEYRCQRLEEYVNCNNLQTNSSGG